MDAVNILADRLILSCSLVVWSVVFVAPSVVPRTILPIVLFANILYCKSYKTPNNKPLLLISIDKEAFRNLENLQEVDFSNCGIQTICEEAFKDCKKLREVKFYNNDSLTNVQIGAFSGCKKIKKVNISGVAGGAGVFDKKAFDGVKLTTK